MLQVFYGLEFTTSFFTPYFLYTPVVTYLSIKSNSSYSERQQYNFSLQIDSMSHDHNNNCTRGTQSTLNLRSKEDFMF